MLKREEWKFFLKNVFNPDESLSRWIIKLAMARTDLTYSHKRLQSLVDQPEKKGETFYYFRIGISHLREAIKLLHFFIDDPQVVRFIKGLPSRNQEQYDYFKIVMDDFDNDNSLIFKSLKPIRDSSFHYYDKSKKKQKNGLTFEEELIQKLKALANTWTGYSAEGPLRIDMDFEFADDICFRLLFETYTEEEYRKSISALSELMSQFIGFSDDAVRFFLSSKRQNMLKITTLR